MTSSLVSRDLVLEPEDNARLANLSGQFDEHLRHIERRLDVEIANRGNHFRVIGDAASAQAGERVLRQLFELTGSERLEPEHIHICLQESGMQPVSEDTPHIALAESPDELVIRTRRKLIRPRGANQTNYLAKVRQHDLSFGIGPAGTGKTYLAVAAAVEALEADQVRRIVLVRPAVEAGERLGFLPGDLTQKVDPYLRPMYDALYEMMGYEQVAKLLERNMIEVAPLAFMRGRSLNESFIILDEAQNTTVAQMKMFLTRIGFGSTAIVTGDVSQIDLPSGQLSGLKHVLRVLSDVSAVGITRFGSRDVVRHPLVQAIVDAYDAYEKKDPPE
ncbi:MAG: PhoH family protein [Pseudomonadota bacterium]